MTENMAAPNPSAAPTEIEKRVALTVKRSHIFRVVTLVLAIVWVCAAIAVASYIRREQQLRAQEIRIAEQQKIAEQVKQNELKAETLKQQAENARLASQYVGSGVFRASHGDANGALADYNKALSYDPNNAAALSYEGYLRLRLGQPEKAEEMLGHSVEIDPNQPWDRYNFSLALWANGKQEEAIAQVKEVLKLDPTFKTIIAKDPQFKKFRANPTFRELINP